MTSPETTFRTLYPDVDPATPIPLTTPERFSLTLSTAVMAFGAALGDLAITAAGLVMLLFSLLVATARTPRRIRGEARSRFPRLPWAEDLAAETLGLRWVLPLTWLAILIICLVTLWLVPESYALSGATAAALISAALIWFAPGLSPRWRMEGEDSAQGWNGQDTELIELPQAGGGGPADPGTRPR